MAPRHPARWLDQLGQDTRHALRAFAKHPGFTLTAVLTIALGMGFNTSLFSVMHSVLFRPLPVSEAESLRNLYVEPRGMKFRASYGSNAFVSFAELQRIRTEATAGDIAGIAEADVSWLGLPGRPVHAQLVSENLLPMIGVRPVVGRLFDRSETALPGSAPVVVLSHSFWQRQLGGPAGIVGTSVTINRTLFTVIGIAAEGARGPLMQSADIWIPLTMQALTRPGESLVDNPGAAWIQLFARSGPAGDAAFLSEMRVVAARAVIGTDSTATAKVSVVPASFFAAPNIRGDVVPALGLIWIAFGLILVVACANVANMLLARSLSRQREVAVRLAVGAGRGRLLRQLLTESVWLGIFGGALGLLIAGGAGRLVSSMIPTSLDLQLDFSPDRSVLAFTALMSILSGVAVGILPALQATRVDLSPSLKTEGLLVAGKPRARLQNTLVGVQVAVCVILLVNAGLVVRSFNRALTMDVGKPLDHLVTASFDLRQQQYTAAEAEQLFKRVTEALRGHPAVVAVGASLLEPELSRNSDLIALTDPTTGRVDSVQVSFDEVAAGYFGAAGLRVLAGRTFTEEEITRDDPVLVVDQRFADGLLGGQAIGKRVTIGRGGTSRAHEIIGVVNNTRPLRTTAASPRANYFAPIAGLRYVESLLWVRYRGDAGRVTDAVRAAVTAVDPAVSTGVRTIEENVRTVLLPVRITSWSLTALGGLALVLASIGLFGVIAFSVGRRAREIAIRMALGAAPRRILALVLDQALRPVAIGTGVGLILAVAGGHLIRALLYGMSPFDPIALGAVLAAVAVSSGIAFWLPARRATSVEPASVLRGD